jgi:hypothetical protein
MTLCVGWFLQDNHCSIDSVGTSGRCTCFLVCVLVVEISLSAIFVKFVCFLVCLHFLQCADNRNMYVNSLMVSSSVELWRSRFCMHLCGHHVYKGSIWIHYADMVFLLVIQGTYVQWGKACIHHLSLVPKDQGVCSSTFGSLIVKVYWFLLHAENLRSLMVAIFCFGITLGVDLRNCPLLPNKESAAFWV